MPFKNLNLPASLLIAIPLLLNGCGANIQGRIDNFCLIYQPVYTAPEDTEITKKQTDGNNISYDCLCKNDDAACDKGGNNPP